MGIEQSIQLYSALFYVFLVIAVLGFGFAAFFFFKFRVPLIFAMETGKAKQKTIEKMMATGDFGLKESEKKSHKVEIYDTMSEELRTRQLTASGNLAQQPAETYENMETTALNVETEATTMLNSSEATTMLNPVDETVVLSGRGDPETSVLGRTDDMAGQTVPLKANGGMGFGAYAGKKANMGTVQIGRFDVIENTVVVNSQEIL